MVARFRTWLVPPVAALLAFAAVPAGAQEPARPAGLTVEVVSSAADQVTGGDARLEIDLPGRIPARLVRVAVNGDDQTDRFERVPGTRTLTGVVDGLQPGDNTVVVSANGLGRGGPGPRTARLRLTNHPITGPVFSGPQQYPFVCTVQRHGLGQPLVDSPDEGFPVTDGAGNVIGYSRDCSAETLVGYVYKAADGSWKDYTPGGDRPADMTQTTTLDGQTVDYVVRWERATINRFISSIAMLAPFDEGPEDLDTTAWNGKVIYHFQGGVAIGHDQGDPSGSRMLYDNGLSLGYAVLYSTGTKTGTHYNLQVGGETALMVKERFVELYGVPTYTVGVGGSGGAIQQYVYAQNHPGVIDAAVPQYSYPDMVTQAIHVGDCELLEYYMDAIDTNPAWATWSNRRWLEGMNASDTFPNPYRGGAPGSTECVNGWRGLTPLVLNPLWGFVDGQEQIVPQSAVQAIQWTHWEDLVNIYGRDGDGYARSTWDNVGVQYGLQALLDGNITPEQFLHLNATVGGWKAQKDMVQEGSPFFPPGVIDPTNWDPWSARNQVIGAGIDDPAPRVEGSIEAMHAIYDAGLVFLGDIDIPVIDWRNYLEPVLDMHNSHQSFAARQRMLNADGDASNHVVWFTAADPSLPVFDQTPEALEVIDEWMSEIDAHPELGVAGNRPARATDRCFDASGAEIASGDGVWNGILDDGQPGACAELFPVYSTSRIVAGGPIEGGVFKCALQPVEQAIADGLYGWWEPSSYERNALEAIFPDGVCDYGRPDVGRPAG